MYTQQIQEARTWLAGQIRRCGYSGIQAPSSKCSAGFCVSGRWRGSPRISCAVFSTVPESSNPECFPLPLRTQSYGHTWMSLTGQPVCPGLFYYCGSYALSFHKLLVGKKYWNWQRIKNMCLRLQSSESSWENCHFKIQLTQSHYIATIKSVSNESSINPDWCTESGKVDLKAHEAVYCTSEIPPFS